MVKSQNNPTINIHGVEIPNSLALANERFDRAQIGFRNTLYRVEESMRQSVAGEVPENDQSKQALSGLTFVNRDLRQVLWVSSGCENARVELAEERRQYVSSLSVREMTELASKYDEFESRAETELGGKYMETRSWFAQLEIFLTPREMIKDKANAVVRRVLELAANALSNQDN